MSYKRYALVGTGSRAGMYIDALTTTYCNSARLVALCDTSQTRMNYYNQQLTQSLGIAPIATYLADRFDQMVLEAKPDIVIVASIDRTHHLYITRAMELGCDVITEKPLTIDAEKLTTIFDVVKKTGQSLRVGFNYRYAPAYTELRKQIMEGVIGKPLAVAFSWLLDTSHGADYFRRWHREKHNSGGLLVHKATHHFDLVNWWINSRPHSVFALGKLAFYGKANAEARGENYPYTRYTGIAEAAHDPFGLSLEDKKSFKGLYLEAEAESGYLRDQNVFGEPITIEDTMAVTAAYTNGVILSYNLIAYSPWEGLRVAITGTKGRIELDIQENVNHLTSDGSIQGAAASKGAFKSSVMTVYPMFGTPYEVQLPAGEGGHGGADPVMLEQLFSPEPAPDPYHRAASHIDGAASVLTGIAANMSIESSKLIYVNDVFPLPEIS